MPERVDLRKGVTSAIRALGNGFLLHPCSGKLREDLASGRLSSEDYFQQLLSVAYRMVVLCTAEENGLLFTPRATDSERHRYRSGYSMGALRDRAARAQPDAPESSLWSRLCYVFEGLAKGDRSLGLAAIGGLFRTEHCHDLEIASVCDNAVLHAVRRLTLIEVDGGYQPVQYKDLPTEEMGSVYETLLELRPIVRTDPWHFAFFGDSADIGNTGSERRVSGAFYTPPALVNMVIQSTLDPVLAQAVDRPFRDRSDAILRIRIIDPACGTGHFLLAAARRVAAELVDRAAIRPDHARRLAIQNCIYGVDSNSMAVEICKVALWLEAAKPGYSNEFLDSKIRHGNSLVGILDPEIMDRGIPGEAYSQLTGDDEAICRDLRSRNRHAVPGFDFDDSEWEELDESACRERMRADLFLSAYYAAKSRDTVEVVPQSQDMNRLVGDMPQRRGVHEFVRELRSRHRFFHWHLEFPAIMGAGGFDVVIGNPPWKRVKLMSQQWFAARVQRIADVRNQFDRDRLIEELNGADASPADRAIYAEFQRARRDAEAMSLFLRTSRRYRLAGDREANLYSLFAETFLQLVGPRGRAGIIVPSGIATDDSSKKYFAHIINHGRLVSLHDFENTSELFPDVSTRMKFCIQTLSGADTRNRQSEFAFFLHAPEDLEDENRRLTMSADDFSLFNPNTRTCPILRTRTDLAIARKLYRRAGVFVREPRGLRPEVNPWDVRLRSGFSMSADLPLFRSRAQMSASGWELDGNVFVRDGERYMPLYEAKLFHQYDHRFATFEGVSDRDIRFGNARRMSAQEKADPRSVSLPRYWVPEAEVVRRMERECMSLERGGEHLEQDQRALRDGAKIVVRRIAATSNLRTCISGFIPNVPLGNSGVGIDCWRIVYRTIAHPGHNRTTIVSATKTSTSTCHALASGVNAEHLQAAVRSVALADRSGEDGFSPDYSLYRAVQACLLMGNMNSLPLDWAARSFISGLNMSLYIVKQFPILPPEIYLEPMPCGSSWLDRILPRVLELTYTSWDMRAFALDLGYDGPPFVWDEWRRACLRAELDACYAVLYGLTRGELEWLVDAPQPSQAFPIMRQREIKDFGEYRTKRLVLAAYDALVSGEPERGMVGAGTN